MQQEIWFQKYKILRLLGRGGTARVYLAEHILLNSYRAIKVISKNHPLYDLQRNEAFILKNLKHSCIPIIYDIEENEEGSYIVEQYLEGETLADFVKSKVSVNEDIIIKFGIQICDLINYLHSIEKPILYVDLKPENIIVSEETLKLIDFGSAVYKDELTDDRSYAGTRGYTAPEAYRPIKIDERCDVYGIGMLLYYMCTGFHLNGKQRMDNIDQVGGCSKQLKNIINQCLRFHPSVRYASVAKLGKELSAIKQKNQLYKNTNKAVRIAVAGAQRRIGVTHFAFRLSNYLNQTRYQSFYLERNNTGCIRSILHRYKEVHLREDHFYYKGIRIQNARNELPEHKGCRVIIEDFGCLTKDNLGNFMNAEIKLLILGAKDWELEYAEEILDMVAEYKEVIYLFNFINGIQFQNIMKSLNRRIGYRVPYEPDPFLKISEDNGLELFKELLVVIKNWS